MTANDSGPGNGPPENWPPGRLFTLQRLALYGSLLGPTRHELNNVLGIVSGCIDLSQRLLPEVLGSLRKGSSLEDQPVAGYLKTIRDSSRSADSACDRTAKLLARFGELERMARSDPGRTRVSACIDAALELLRPRSKRFILQVSLLGDEAAPAVRIGQAHLIQCLLNLLNNGLDALEERQGGPGELRITHTRDAQRSRQVVRVADNGPGLSPEATTRLFEPFFSTRPPETHAGLALFASRRIARASGGELQPVNSGESGACFELSLPE
jgi:C4-dicarboxylate-specific signal transduction histidine kinase